MKLLHLDDGGRLLALQASALLWLVSLALAAAFLWSAPHAIAPSPILSGIRTSALLAALLLLGAVAALERGWAWAVAVVLGCGLLPYLPALPFAAWRLAKGIRGRVGPAL